MRRRFTTWLVIAGAAHVALLASVRERGARVAPRVPEVTIEVTTEPEEPATATPAPSASPSPLPTPPATPLPTTPPTAPRSPTATATASAPASAPAPAPASASASASPSPSASPWNGWSLAFRDPGASPSPSSSAAPAHHAVDSPFDLPASDPLSATGGLRESLHAHDAAIGLGSGGPVLGIAESATSASRAPVDGFAVLIATFGPDGVVADVRVVDANGDRTAWDDVASEIARAMKSKHVKVPPGARGVEVTLRIDSRWQNHDGSDPDPYKVCVPPIPCNAAPGRRTITLNPLGLGGPIDPTSAAPPLRVVHARIVAERSM